MSENPYGAPNAPVERNDPAAAIPADVLSKIKGAWIAATISGSLTLIITLIAMAGTSMMGFSAANLIDVALIFGLAYGIYRKSRTCALIMLLYFVASKIYMMKQAGAPSGLLLSIVFTIFFVQGVIGTFKYHSIVGSGR